MMLPFLALIALQHQQQGPQQQTLPPSPIAKVIVTPTQRTVTIGDSLQLRGEAVDVSGQKVLGATLRFVPAGAWFEGSVDSTGLVRAGAVGTLPVTAVAIVPGTKPVVERVEVRMVPGATARVAISPRVARLVVGQRLRLAAQPYSAGGDERDDRVTWRSSAPTRLRISPEGLATALAPGSVTLSASAGGATEQLVVDVIANTVASLDVTPSSAEARQGDVITFKVSARDATGRAITGLTPSWSVSPGRGQIDDEGKFVGYEPGTYLVTATVGTRSTDVPVTLTHRDVRRPVRVVGRLPRMQ